jgi:hypothetical protein
MEKDKGNNTLLARGACGGGFMRSRMVCRFLPRYVILVF